MQAITHIKTAQEDEEDGGAEDEHSDDRARDGQARIGRETDDEEGDRKERRRPAQSLEPVLGRNGLAVERVVLSLVVRVEVEDVDEDGQDSSSKQSKEDESSLSSVQAVVLDEDDGNGAELQVNDSVGEGHCREGASE